MNPRDLDRIADSYEAQDRGKADCARRRGDDAAKAHHSAAAQQSNAIYAGVVGEVVGLFDPHTEADPLAVATQFLVGLGNVVGRRPHVRVGETVHHCNEFLALVGRTARSRKGDSRHAAHRVLHEADPTWPTSGNSLSSGEGLIYAVRDSASLTKWADPGVTDKRLMVVATEFSAALQQFTRRGNTLSETLRDAWDGAHVLRTLTKNSPTAATDAHVSVIAHTTPEDLHAHLSTLDAANGLGNRFLFCHVDRSKLLPNPGSADANDVEALADTVRSIIRHARDIGELRRTAEANEFWADIYKELTRDESGLVGKLVARAEAHVVRLSSLYALSSQSPVIDVPHIESALALWRVCDRSVRRIFSGRTGDDLADRILRELHVGERISITDLHHRFNRHVGKARLDTALNLLESIGALAIEEEATGGRPRRVVIRLGANNSAPGAEGPL